LLSVALNGLVLDVLGQVKWWWSRVSFVDYFWGEVIRM